MVAVSCGQHGRRVEHADHVVDVLGIRTEWSPRRADSVVAVSSVRTDWLPRHADRVVTLSSVQTKWLQCGADGVVATSCGPRGRLVVRTDALDTV